jgi:hypothetical protein
MPQLTVATNNLPPNAQGYFYAIADAPGVVAANNFLSVFNPAGSVKSIAWLAAFFNSYVIGTSGTPNSMIIYRTTAASGGTLVSPANIGKFVTAQPNSVVEVRTGNPTVTLLNSQVVFSCSPPLGSGNASASPASSSPPGGAIAISLPGEGLVFSTAAGNVNQMWGVEFDWAEY